jgi:hypothetical protein
MAHMAYPMPFSPSSATLPTWIGTAMHEKLERLIAQHVGSLGTCLLEHRTVCGEIAGYGRISGNVDLFHVPTGTVVDWKGSKKDKIRDYKMNGSGQQYRVQRNLYGLGLHAEGYDVRSVANFYIPRDGFSLSEIYYEVEPFDPDIALRALARATTIWNMVLAGELPDLGSDPECFHCNSLTLPTGVLIKRNGARRDESPSGPTDPILGI